MDPSNNETTDLALLRSIGLGPESALMNQPRILGDEALLKSLRTELREKLGPDLSRHAFAQIGFYHGLRDSLRTLSISREGYIAGAIPLPGIPAISLRLQRFTHNPSTAIHGTWDDAVETKICPKSDSTQCLCIMTAGYTSGWLSGLCGGSIFALEIECRGSGCTRCRFIAQPSEAWRVPNSEADLAIVDSLAFEPFRRSIESRAAAPQTPAGPPTDESAPAVYVWGPVMILPFGAPDEVLWAAETLEESGDHRDIQAVVVDFKTARMDPQTDTGALESLLCRFASWGAEPVLANLSDAMASTLPHLDAGPWLTRPTRAEAIASAFQIVDVQKHQL